MEKEIYKTQISSLKLAKNYIQSCKLKGIDIGISPFCDFVVWADCLGHQKLKNLYKKEFINFDYLKIFAKEILSVGKNHSFTIQSSKIKQVSKINIIYSYCTKKNFTKDGTFNDSYFSQSSKKNKNIYWFLISLDNFVPKKKKNIFIIYKKKKTFNFLYLIKYISKNFFKKNNFHSCNNTTNISKIYSNFFYNALKKHKFNLYIPYESRPHQNAIIKITKKISNKNKIYGYYHRMPEPFQSEMIYKIKDIDKLYVCSMIQKRIFSKHFLWPSKKLQIINSLRYSKLLKRDKFIFLPYEIKDVNSFFKCLKKLLLLKQANINGFDISIHPLKKNNKNHIGLKHKIENEIFVGSRYNLNNSKRLDAPIIIGEPGSVASEMLDTIGKVYHISNSHLDIFSEKIWKSIKVKKISESIYEYKKLSKVKLLNTNGKKDNFENLLKQNEFNN